MESPKCFGLSTPVSDEIHAQLQQLPRSAIFTIRKLCACRLIESPRQEWPFSRPITSFWNNLMSPDRRCAPQDAELGDLATRQLYNALSPFPLKDQSVKTHFLKEFVVRFVPVNPRSWNLICGSFAWLT